MKKRGKKYQAIKEKIAAKVYSSDEAIKFLKENVGEKFDAALEMHIRLGVDTKKSDEQVRGVANLPHGTGKKIRIAAFVPAAKVQEAKEAGATIVGGEELIEKIKQTEKCDFDIAVATPDMMRFLSKLGKILGTKGLMPSPKNETITPDPQKTIQSLLSGKVSFRADETGNIHQILGKMSFAEKQLAENLNAFVDAVKKARPAALKGEYIKGVVVKSTMSPGLKIKI